ncbi:MAG: hypothetical protein IJ643_11750 [Eubacterium sp.]|nr:hypothetical protein [Eubacterium sp.]
MPSTRQIVMDATSTASLSGGGLLRPDQAEKFIQQTFDATVLGQQVRHVMKRAKTGEIDKIGIAKRIIRKKTEGVDDGYRAGIETSKIEYATTAIRLPWEITEETFRENIEGQHFEEIQTNLMTTQFGLDLLDLYLNGDESTDASDPDYDFLKINDGWLKQLNSGSHIEDRTSKDSGAMSIDVYYDALAQMPNKYNNGTLRWIMSPHRQQEWTRHLLKKIIEAGGAVPQGVYDSPAAIPTISCPSFSDNEILLIDPKNLVVVNTYNMVFRKTNEGKEAVMQDKRFYTMHMDFDTIIEELDAAVLIKGLAQWNA